MPIFLKLQIIGRGSASLGGIFCGCAALFAEKFYFSVGLESEFVGCAAVYYNERRQSRKF